MIIQIKLLVNFSSHFIKDTKLFQKHERGESILSSVQFKFCIISQEWVKKKKAKIDPKKEDDKCFQCAATAH